MKTLEGIAWCNKISITSIQNFNAFDICSRVDMNRRSMSYSVTSSHTNALKISSLADGFASRKRANHSYLSRSFDRCMPVTVLFFHFQRF